LVAIQFVADELIMLTGVQLHIFAVVYVVWGPYVGLLSGMTTSSSQTQEATKSNMTRRLDQTNGQSRSDSVARTYSSCFIQMAVARNGVTSLQ
jgi:hypothetical protein